MDHNAAGVSRNLFGGKRNCAMPIPHSCQHKFH